MLIRKKKAARLLTIALALIFAMGLLAPHVSFVKADGDDFVKKVTYKSGEEVLQPNPDGSYTVELNKDYEVDLEFEESEGSQFPSDQLVYQLPTGINPAAVEGDLSIDFSVVDAGGTVTNKELKGNHYTIEADGKITVTWNTSDEAYSAFEDCGNVSFILQFSGFFDGNSTELTFSDSVKTTINVDDTADVTVRKSGQYDPQTNKVKYTATVTGKKGSSSNVVVTDELKGTALKLDADSIKISKNPVTAAEPAQQSVSESGFTYNIATVNAGDVYTFTYTASVEIDKVTGDGTAEQTENDISIKSDEHPEPYTETTDLKDSIHYTDINKNVELEKNDDGTTSIKWTIKYGDKDSKASLAGFTLTDKLMWSERLTYDTTHHPEGISVRENDKTPYNVSWSNVGVTTGKEQSWKWTIPDGAPGNTEYTITYYTLYDTTGQITAEHPANSVEDGHGHKADKGIDVGHNDIGLVKKFSGFLSDNNAASWTITITVPASGLKTAVLNDWYPKKTINGTEYTEPVDFDSIHVSGLLNGENYRITKSDSKHFEMTFASDYTDDGTAYALKPSSESRTITVTLNTKKNQDWIDVSKDSDKSSDRVHINGASFYGNGQRLWSQNGYSTNEKFIDKTAQNDGNPVGYFKDPNTVKGFSKTASSDTDLPCWQFKIALEGVYGDIDITDKFNTDLFEIVPETVENESKTDNRRVYGADTSHGTDINGDISRVTVTPAKEGASLHIDSDKLPKYQNNEDLYYSKYFIVYYVRVKSPEALQKLRTICAEQGKDLKASLTNEVTYDTKTDTADFYYTYEGAKKEIVKEAYVDPTDGYTYADFKIVLNPTAAEMDANSDTLTAADTWSESLAVKPDSFAFKDASGNDISDRVSYDIQERTATFTIPDKTAVTVTYRARILGTGEVDYSNTATIKGYISGRSATAAVSSSGGGSGSVFTVYLLKYAEGNMNQHLGGATFSLYRMDASGSKVPVKDKNGNTVTFTTDDNGKATLFGSQKNDGWSFYEGTRYFLHEESAPTGFIKLSKDYAFQLSKTKQDWDEHLYINGDTIMIPNEKITEFSFTKIWNDHDNNDGIRPSSDPSSDNYFGRWLHLYKTENGVETEVSGYSPTITVDRNDSSKWTVSYENLPVIDGTYSVREIIPGSDYFADYGAQDQTAVSNKGTLTNTHEDLTEDLSITKKWADGDGADRPDASTFAGWLHLCKKVGNADAVDLTAASPAGTYEPTIEQNGSTWNVTYKDLPSRENGNKVSYYITEVIPDGSSYIASCGAEDQNSVSDGGTLLNTDAHESSISIPVRKKWADGARGEKAVLILTANGRKTDRSLELNADNNWKSSFDNLPKYDQNGSEIKYGIIEATLEWKYTVKPDDQEGFIVTNHPKNAPDLVDSEQQTGRVISTGDPGLPIAPLAAAACAAAAVIGRLALRRRRTR
ncbi:MAG: Cna B-type domain-containing protein [Anaerovoracaceae bacterium]|jgi:hypothetical protein